MVRSSVGILGIVLLGFATTLSAQSEQKQDDDSAPFVLKKLAGNPITLPSDNPVYEGPVRCGMDGAIYVNTIVTGTAEHPLPTATNETHLISVDHHGTAHTFEISSMSDLEEVRQVMALDIGLHEAVLLDYGKRNTLHTALDRALPRSWYLAHFDLSGTYIGSTQIDLGVIEVFRIGIFDNGDLLIFGFDPKTSTPQLLRYTAIGGQLQSFAIDQPFAEKTPIAPKPPSGANLPTLPQSAQRMNQVRAAVGLTQIAHFRNTLLLIQMNAADKLYQIYPNGSVRTVQLPHLNRYTVDSIIPSQDLWYIRYREIGTTDGRGENSAILEVNPTTGDALRRIAVFDWTVWDVACKQRDSFDVMRMSPTGGIEFVLAAIAPTN